MRNPDKWQPPDLDPDPTPVTRGVALVGLILVLLLVLGGLVLTHILGDMTRVQDCALSGRSNCSTSP